MDSGSLALNAIAIIISVLALVASGLLSVRQLRSMRHANSVPVAIEMLTREFSKEDFQDKESLVLEQLADHFLEDLAYRAHTRHPHTMYRALRLHSMPTGLDINANLPPRVRTGRTRVRQTVTQASPSDDR
jgi:hypothetical protein